MGDVQNHDEIRWSCSTPCRCPRHTAPMPDFTEVLQNFYDPLPCVGNRRRGDGDERRWPSRCFLILNGPKAFGSNHACADQPLKCAIYFFGVRMAESALQLGLRLAWILQKELKYPFVQTGRSVIIGPKGVFC